MMFTAQSRAPSPMVAAEFPVTKASQSPQASISPMHVEKRAACAPAEMWERCNAFRYEFSDIRYPSTSRTFFRRKRSTPLSLSGQANFSASSMYIWLHPPDSFEA